MTNRAYISDYYREQQEMIESVILRESDETILYSATEELVAYYCSHHSFAPIEFDPERQPSFEHTKAVRIVPAHRREAIYQNEGGLKFEYESIIITFPIIPNENTSNILSLTGLWRIL